MAGEAGLTEHPLIQALLREPHRFSFFQAVQLIERSVSWETSVGRSGPAAKETIRFRPSISLGFPRSSIEEIERLPRPGAAADDPEIYRITACFLGLYGTQTPLPNFYSEEILRENADDPAVRDFLDIFHHRVYAFFYRAWSKYRFHAEHETDGSDPFSLRLLSLIGLANREVRAAWPLSPVRLIRYAGLLASRRTPADGLRALLSDWFGGLPVQIESCSERWVQVPAQDKNRLGSGQCVLGESLTLGDRVYDRAGGYRVVIGPVDLPTYERFLPEGPDNAIAASLCALYTGDLLEPALTVRLRGDQVPDARLDTENPYRLGWTSWLHAGDHAEAGVDFSLRGTA